MEIIQPSVARDELRWETGRGTPPTLKELNQVAEPPGGTVQMRPEIPNNEK